MFERFTAEARQVVVSSQDEARRLHHHYIGTEHLLLGLLDDGSPTAAVFVRHGLTRTAATETIQRFMGREGLDAAALGTVGIDLDSVRDSVEAAFGPGALDDPAPGRGRDPKGHLPFTRRAKKVLELSLREALALKSGSISDGHIALGLIRDGGGVAMKVIHDRGIDPDVLRREITASMTG